MPKRDRLARIFFIASCTFLAFVYGFGVGFLQWFPHSFMASAASSLAPSQSNGNPDATPVAEGAARTTHHKRPARHDFVGVTTGDRTPAANAEGITLLTSYWPETGWLPGIRLIDSKGEPLLHWHIDIQSIWPTNPYSDPAVGQFYFPTNYVHGSHLFPNGDVLFSVEYLGLVRMSAKGKVVWRLDRRTHHCVHPDENGNFWVCAAKMLNGENVQRRFRGLGPRLSEDQVLLISPNGKVLREISILELVFRSKHQALVWTTRGSPKVDVLHVNDVEPLPSAIADQYPLFEAGDLMISMRSLNLVLVFDPKTLQIKWSAAGEFIAQHDPDFIGGGWISVFDNRHDGSNDGRFLGGSRLSATRPHTGESRQIYPRNTTSTHERPFHTSLGGKVQQLSGGHWLITESTAGRVFEIDEAGRTVWEWGHERHSDGMISEVLEGTRYHYTREQVLEWRR